MSSDTIPYASRRAAKAALRAVARVTALVMFVRTSFSSASVSVVSVPVLATDISSSVSEIRIFKSRSHSPYLSLSIRSANIANDIDFGHSFMNI